MLRLAIASLLVRRYSFASTDYTLTFPMLVFPSSFFSSYFCAPTMEKVPINILRTRTLFVLAITESVGHIGFYCIQHANRWLWKFDLRFARFFFHSFQMIMFANLFDESDILLPNHVWNIDAPSWKLKNLPKIFK